MARTTDNQLKKLTLVVKKAKADLKHAELALKSHKGKKVVKPKKAKTTKSVKKVARKVVAKKPATIAKKRVKRAVLKKAAA